MPETPVHLFPSPQLAEEFLATRLAEAGPWQETLVVVPSASLRAGLATALCRRKSAWVGVGFLTLQGLAHQVLQEAGQAALGRDGLLPLLTSRVARTLSHPELAMVASLDQVGALAATVRDLLDAGFSPHHLEACQQVVEEAGLGGVGQRRAKAVLEVAAEVAAALASWGLQRRSDILQRAAQVLQEEPNRRLRASRLLVYGFADVTAVAGDFLQALSRTHNLELLLVIPPDPVAPEAWAGRPFVNRLGERFGLSPQVVPNQRPPLPSLELWSAPGVEAEVRAVAEDIGAFLAAGGQAEEVAVVARDLGPYALPIRRLFAHLGIPFSGVGGVAGLHPALPLLQRLLALVAEGENAEVEGLLALSGLAEESARPGPALESLVRARGANTLRQLGQPGSSGQEPIVRQGSGPSEGWEQLLALLASRPQEAAAEQWGQLTLQVAKLLGLPPRDVELLQQVVEKAVGEAGFVPLSAEEWAYLAGQKGEEVLAVPLGGQGAGVAVLSAMEARFRTFRRLYLVGMVRDLFPQLAREDPLLPEPLRQKLSWLLPDLPCAARRGEEERYLFGLLLASAQEVRLCWPQWDEEGKPLAPSPYVEELRAVPGPWKACKLPPPLALRNPGRWGSAGDWAQVAALEGHGQAWQRLLGQALNQQPLALACRGEEVAAARGRVLREWDPPPGPLSLTPSPYLGFLGSLGPYLRGRSAAAAVQELGEKLPAFAYVSFWESYARCPWQAFLQRVLKLRPWSPGDEDLSPALVGSLVHRVLARVVREALGEPTQPWQERLALGNQPVPWPENEQICQLCLEEAQETLAQAGMACWPGLVEGLAQAAQPYLERARQLLFPQGQGEFVGAEEEGCLWVDGFPLRFRFDALQVEEGRPRFLDYKTGHLGTSTAQEEKVLTALAQGRLLQGVAYALAGPGEGRYVDLRPQEAEPYLSLAASPQLEAAFARIMHLLLTAAAKGIFFPRLVDAKDDSEPPACRTCEVRLACGRGESAVRRRLREWGHHQQALAQEGKSYAGQLFCLKAEEGEAKA
jgi:RecB family exonuclease